MEILFIITIVGLIGLLLSAGLLYMSYQTPTDSLNEFERQKRDDFFNRVKLNSSRLK